MTDNEIIKALECCTTKGASCSNCPAFVKVDRSNCKQFFIGALDLINRKKAELERLTELNKVLDRDVFNAEMNLDGLQQHIFEIRETEAELKFRKKKVQAEAIQEFAERLKGKVYKPGAHPGVEDEFIIEVDNLVKEMVGDSND